MYDSISTVKEGKQVGCPPGFVPVRKYNWARRNITAPQNQVPIGENVNGFTVKNVGNTIVNVNNIPLQPTESLSVGGNEGEIFQGFVNISFTLPTPPPGTPVNSCWVIWKYYMP